MARTHKVLGTTLQLSSVYRLESDGQTEVMNRSLESYLRYFVGDKPKQWAKWLRWADYWFNTTYNCFMGMNPFQALYLRETPTFLEMDDIPSHVEEVNG